MAAALKVANSEADSGVLVALQPPEGMQFVANHASNADLDLTIVEAARLIAHGDLSPVMLTQAYLDRIERLEPQLGSFITLTAQAALEQARAQRLSLLGTRCHGA